MSAVNLHFQDDRGIMSRMRFGGVAKLCRNNCKSSYPHLQEDEPLWEVAESENEQGVLFDSGVRVSWCRV